MLERWNSLSQGWKVACGLAMGLVSVAIFMFLILRLGNVINPSVKKESETAKEKPSRGVAEAAEPLAIIAPEEVEEGDTIILTLTGAKVADVAWTSNDRLESTGKPGEYKAVKTGPATVEAIKGKETATATFDVVTNHDEGYPGLPEDRENRDKFPHSYIDYGFISVDEFLDLLDQYPDVKAEYEKYMKDTYGVDYDYFANCLMFKELKADISKHVGYRAPDGQFYWTEQPLTIRAGEKVIMFTTILNGQKIDDPVARGRCINIIAEVVPSEAPTRPAPQEKPCPKPGKISEKIKKKQIDECRDPGPARHTDTNPPNEGVRVNNDPQHVAPTEGYTENSVKEQENSFQGSNHTPVGDSGTTTPVNTPPGNNESVSGDVGGSWGVSPTPTPGGHTEVPIDNKVPEPGS